VSLAVALALAACRSASPSEPPAPQPDPNARKAHALVEFCVDPAGAPMNVQIVESTGDPKLDAVVVGQVERMRVKGLKPGACTRFDFSLSLRP
jgi:TonB family protein